MPIKQKFFSWYWFWETLAILIAIALIFIGVASLSSCTKSSSTIQSATQEKIMGGSIELKLISPTSNLPNTYPVLLLDSEKEANDSATITQTMIHVNQVMNHGAALIGEVQHDGFITESAYPYAVYFNLYQNGMRATVYASSKNLRYSAVNWMMNVGNSSGFTQTFILFNTPNLLVKILYDKQ